MLGMLKAMATTLSTMARKPVTRQYPEERRPMSQILPAGSLSGKTALVTGSSRGIGADTVRYLAEAGANVVINFRNKAPRAEKLAAQLRELGVEALVVGAEIGRAHV